MAHSSSDSVTITDNPKRPFNKTMASSNLHSNTHPKSANMPISPIPHTILTTPDSQTAAENNKNPISPLPTLTVNPSHPSVKHRPLSFYRRHHLKPMSHLTNMSGSSIASEDSGVGDSRSSLLSSKRTSTESTDELKSPLEFSISASNILNSPLDQDDQQPPSINILREDDTEESPLSEQCHETPLTQPGGESAVSEHYSISTDALSGLMEAILKIADDVKPLPPPQQQQKEYRDSSSDEDNDMDGPFKKREGAQFLNHLTAGPTPRRRSLMDLYDIGCKRLNTSAQRKLSVPPQRYTPPLSGETERRQRKPSACIVCERKRARCHTESDTVIIKTSMQRRQQKDRRYSMPLKVYQADDVVTKRIVLRPHPHTLNSQLREIIDSNLPKFIQFTNWSCMLQYLIPERLLDPNSIHMLMNSSVSDLDKGNHFYIKVLPSQGDDAYVKFYECLKQATQHRGHDSLCEVIEGGLKDRNPF